MITIDVRIVAATNESLEEKVEEGSFRRDLYYRLNTLPIMIPPLAQRGGDMFLLIDRFKEELGGGFELTEPIEKFLREYSWPGNIRELRNVVEYFIYTGHEKITMEDLPPTVLRRGQQDLRPVMVPARDRTSDRGGPVRKASDNEHFAGESSGEEETFDREAFWFVLGQLYEASEEGSFLGREKILARARECHFPVSQQEVRSVLSEMSKQGLARVSRGRGGSRLTPKGRRLWEDHQDRF